MSDERRDDDEKNKPRYAVEFNPYQFKYCPFCSKEVADHKPGEYDRHLIELSEEIAGRMNRG